MEQKWANKLNNDEFNLVTDTWYPLLKKSAITKIKAQMRLLGEQMQVQLPGYGFKISSGENFQDMPYLVMDYPKIEGPKFRFLFRVLFWWGHPVSFHFFFRVGSNREIARLLLERAGEGVLALTNQQLWENDFRTDAFKEIKDMGIPEKESLMDAEFLKLVLVAKNNKPDDLFEEAIGFYKMGIELLSASEKGS